MVSRTLLAVFALTMFMGSISAQTIITLGNAASPSSGGNSWPFNFAQNKGRYQHCWTAAEVNMPTGGTITAIRATRNNGTVPMFTNLRVRLAHTNTLPQAMSPTFDSNYSGTLTTCLGPVNYTPTSMAGYEVFQLSTPFQYNGTSGLLLDWSYDNKTLGAGWSVSYSGAEGRNRVFAYGGSYTTVTGTMDVGGDWLLQMVVTPGFGISTFSPLAIGGVTFPYNVTVQAANGTTPYTWSLPVTGLPPGLSAAQVAGTLRITGTPTTAGTFSFTLTVNDSAARQAQKAFSIQIVPAPAALPYLDTFSTDKGWQFGPTWTRGIAKAYFATTPTRSEPGTDATTTSTDNMIIGDTIGGDYSSGLATTFWATSPLINCSGAAGVQLRFKRWLGVGLGDNVKIQVSNNASTWTDVYTNMLSPINDTAWASFTYDLTAVAAGRSTVQVRFGVGPSDPVQRNVGWCIDDFEVLEAGPALEVREGGTGGTLIADNQAVGGLRDFGSVQIGVQSTPLTVALKNNGASPITFGTFGKSGANPGDFYVNAGTLTNPLPVGQSTTFTVTFYATTGSSPGTRSATISIPHNASSPGGGSFEINVQANATSAPSGVLEVRLGSVTGSVIAFNQSASGTARDFGNQDISAGPSPQITIFVLNTGTGVLNLSVPVMGGAWWNQYVLDTSGFATSLSAGANTSFKVAFDPNVVQTALDALVRLAHSDTTQTTPFDIPVIGNGTSVSAGASMNIREGGASGAPIAHNQAAIGSGRDFGNQVISAGPTAALTIYIQNTGGASLTLGIPVLGGAQAGEFALNTASFVTSLATSGSTTFTIAFDPSSVGVKSATVTLTHNDAAQTSPFIINVTGTGVNATGIIGVRTGGATGPVLTNPAPATGPLNFGTRDISAGPSAAVLIYIENTGTAAMTLGAPLSSGAGAAEFVLDTTGYTTTVAAAGSTSFTIAFDPTTIGVKSAAVSLTHNGSGTSSPFVINVTGNAVFNSPVIEVREDSTTGAIVTSGATVVSGGGRDFSSIDIAAGATPAKPIFILNTGNQPLVLGTPSVTGPNAGDFLLNLGAFSATVAPAGSTRIDLSFDPGAVGVKDASIQFNQNDASSPSPFVVPVQGLGTSPTGVVILTGSLPSANVGKAYTPVTFAASQGTQPYSWSLHNSTLPAGLNLSAAGVIDGTPAGPTGVFDVTIRVTDAAGGTDDRLLSITVNGDLILSNGGGNGGGCAAVDGVQWEVLTALATLLAALALKRRRKRA